MKRFLIVKTSSIGDVLQCLSLLLYLKGRFPKATIDWVVEKPCAPLLSAHPYIDRVLEVDTKLWRTSVFKHRKAIASFKQQLRERDYDVLFDLQANTKSGVITALAKARKKVGYGWSSVAEKPNYLSTNVHLPIIQEGNIRSRYAQLLINFFGEQLPPPFQAIQFRLHPEEYIRLGRLEQLCFQRPRLMVCFGSNWSNKQLKKETLIDFLHLINDKLAPAFFFIWGNQKEKRFAEELEATFAGNSHAVGDLSLPLWQRFMGVVEGVISMDSAALHLCGTTSTPSFSLFGPSSAKVYKPMGKHHVAFQGKCPYEIEFDKRCPQLRTCETGACLHDVSSQTIFDHFLSFWNQVEQDKEIVCESI